MVDPRIQRLARLLVEYCAPVRAGDKVEIAGTMLAAPLLREIYRHTLLAGGYPFLRMALPDQSEIFLKTAGEAQLTYLSPIDQLTM